MRLFLLLLTLTLTVLICPASASVVDYGPPQDILGHWEFDLYDATGAQRGTTSNPLQIGLPPGAATAANQATMQSTLTSILNQLPAYPWTSKTIIGNGTTTLKTGSGTLHGFVINNNATGGVLYLYDNTSGSGTITATGNAGTPSGGLLSGSGNPGAVFIGPLDVTFTNGLTAVTSGSTTNSFTVIWK